jgi:poly(A) polymerase|tara:strand:- start:533 stop:1258 length:726 start_codon:yes stop_codon:yes gene_type:complete
MIKLFEVGGCVRDELLGVHTKDIDFTVVLDDINQTVDQGWNIMLTFLKDQGFKIFLETKDCFTVRAMFPKGHQHEGLVADFVLARKEVGVINGTRKPILELGTLSDDLMRRDFTVNALAKDENGLIIDEWRGLQALQQKTLRTPLDPMVTLMDDPLRLLRALRFSITKGFRIATPLMDAMLQKGLLDKLSEVVSQERMREEVQKMMQHDTVKSLKLLSSIPGLIEVVFSNGLWLMPTMKKA